MLWIALLAVAGLLVLASFLLGVFVGFKQLPPVSVLRANYNSIVHHEEYETIPNIAFETDIDELNTIHGPADVERKRAELIEFIWRGEGLPAGEAPEKIELDIKDNRFANIPNLARIDEYTIEMEHGVNSIAYHFHPERATDGLLIYHQGHSGGFVKEQETIAHFVDAGYAVLAFSMPLKGMNNTPTTTLDRLGIIRLTSHDRLQYLERDDYSPIKYFLHPMAVGVEHALAEYDYEFVAMTGISGGGWTTHLYSAIDPRISRSYPIDGALPLFLRTLPPSNDLGHYETEHAELYRTCNHLELFTMGAYGDGRKQLQVLNKYAWAGGNRYQVYEPHIRERLAEAGLGEFEVYVDVQRIHLRTQHHQISNRTKRIITSDLRDVSDSVN